MKYKKTSKKKTYIPILHLFRSEIIGCNFVYWTPSKTHFSLIAFYSCTLYQCVHEDISNSPTKSIRAVKKHNFQSQYVFNRCGWNLFCLRLFSGRKLHDSQYKNGFHQFFNKKTCTK